VRAAVATLRRAAVSVKMVTGDARPTALAIGKLPQACYSLRVLLRPARRGEQILITLKTEVLVFVVRFIFACAPLLSFRMLERDWWEIISGADRLRSRTFSRSRSRSAPIACSSERIRFQTASSRST
jgi:magnesium-transporting ATPase (P-type)